MLFKQKHGLIVVIFCVTYFPFTATAGFNEALTAFQAKDYSTAATEARQVAVAGDARGSYLLGVIYQSGLGVPANATEAAAWYEKAVLGQVVGAYSKLAQLYMRGDGVEKNQDKALAYARRSDQLGDPEGSFFLYVILNSGPLGHLDATGKPDQTKYKKLASRSISERSLDIEAKDALYRSAAKNYPLGELMLAITLGGTVGDGNRDRMINLVAKLPNHTNQALKNYEKVSQLMDKWGTSYTSPQLFIDAQTSQMVSAMIQACGIRDPKDTTKAATPEITAVAISKPLNGAVFLPSKVSGNEHSYLVTGEWEETWTYRACNKTVNVIVKFTADGMGGAYFSSTQTGLKKDAGSSSSEKL
jgi:TPR repeat protein